MPYLFFLDKYQQEWRSKALCCDMGPNDFFPVDSNNRMIYSKETSPLIHKTASVCDQCPVAVECLRDALENNMQGIWAGMSYSYRQYIMKNLFDDDPFKIDDDILRDFISFLRTLSVRSRFRFKYTPDYLGKVSDESFQ